MKWKPIDLAPKDGSYVDLWAGSNRYAFCFWSTERECWITRVRFVQKDGSQGTIHNKVVNPTHFIVIEQPC
jgi:hypothetical protein